LAALAGTVFSLVGIAGSSRSIYRLNEESED